MGCSATQTQVCDTCKEILWSPGPVLWWFELLEAGEEAGLPMPAPHVEIQEVGPGPGAGLTEQITRVTGPREVCIGKGDPGEGSLKGQVTEATAPSPFLVIKGTSEELKTTLFFFL